MVVQARFAAFAVSLCAVGSCLPSDGSEKRRARVSLGAVPCRIVGQYRGSCQKRIRTKYDESSDRIVWRCAAAVLVEPGRVRSNQLRVRSAGIVHRDR